MQKRWNPHYLGNKIYRLLATGVHSYPSVCHLFSFYFLSFSICTNLSTKHKFILFFWAWANKPSDSRTPLKIKQYVSNLKTDLKGGYSGWHLQVLWQSFGWSVALAPRRVGAGCGACQCVQCGWGFLLFLRGEEKNKINLAPPSSTSFRFHQNCTVLSKSWILSIFNLSLRTLTFDLRLNPLVLIHAVVRSVFFFGRLSALAKTYSFAIFGCSVGWCETKFTNSKNQIKTCE